MTKDLIETYCSNSRYTVVFSKFVSTYLIATKVFTYQDGESFSQFFQSKKQPTFWNGKLAGFTFV